MLWYKAKKRKGPNNYNRTTMVLAIIFLLLGALLLKLFNLQVINRDYYIAIASGQHEVFSKLAPQRGRIFIQDMKNTSGNSNLYPLATNKDLAAVFAIPKEMEQPSELAEKLFIFFKQPILEKQAEEQVAREEKEKLDQDLAVLADLPEEQRLSLSATLKNRYLNKISSSEYPQYVAARKKAIIEEKKQNYLEKYFAVLTKKNDPYEPLERKLEEEDLKKLYALLLTSNEQTVSAEQLVLKEGEIYLKEKTDDLEKLTRLKVPGIDFNLEPSRYYPEANIGSHVSGFVGYVGDEERGKYGLEGYFDNELYGQYGSIRAERDAKGEIIIINDKEYNKPVNGSDFILTIDRSIQYIACTKLNNAVRRHGADGGSVIVVEPKTGAILAMCSAPDYNPNNFQSVEDIKIFNNPAVFGQYEPGSIFKVITMAMGLDQGKVIPDSTYNDTGMVKIANYEIKNSDLKSHGITTMTGVLENSLNTGAIHVMRQITPNVFDEYVKKFGFGERTGVELEGESKGSVSNLFNTKQNKETKELAAATASFGQGIAVTPLQISLAFAAIANDGILMKPYIVKERIKQDGTKEITEPRQLRQVVSERASILLGGMMVNVVENGHGKKAGVAGYYVGGKTGTAQVPKKSGKGYEENVHIGSFAGFAPVDDPVFAMLVKIDHPRDVEWAESSAAPLFGEIAEFILNYYQIPKERETK